QRIANAGVFDARPEYQRQQAHRRGRPDSSPGGLAAQLVGPQFHDVGFTELEVDGLVTQWTRHLDFDGVEKRPAAWSIVDGLVNRAASRFPAGDGERAGARSWRVGIFEGAAYFDAQRAAIVGTGGGGQEDTCQERGDGRLRNHKSPQSGKGHIGWWPDRVPRPARNSHRRARGPSRARGIPAAR